MAALGHGVRLPPRLSGCKKNMSDQGIEGWRCRRGPSASLLVERCGPVNSRRLPLRGSRGEALRPAASPQAARPAVRAPFLAHGNSRAVALAAVVTAVAVADAVGP